MKRTEGAAVLFAVGLVVCACSPEVRHFGSGGAGGSGVGGEQGTNSTGATTSSGSGIASSSSGFGPASSSSGGGCASCMGFSCCGANCVNAMNDIKNCGMCGNVCTDTHPYCDHGKCGIPPCDPQVMCAAGETCCGKSCCAPGTLCCSVPGPLGEQLGCHPPTPQGTCPMGCLQCMCTSPDTPIATPNGDRPIAELVPGDLVYSVRGQGIVAVTILRVNKVAVQNHQVVHVELDSGAVLEISPKHPTADGRTFAELRPGDRLDSARVVAVRLIPYAHPFTHDILPDSDTGTYFAAGALIGSTLHGTVDVGRARAE